MSLKYTVTEVSPGFNDWDGTPTTGPIRYFSFKFRDSEGGVGEGSLGRKLVNGQAPAPTVGFEFYADAKFNAEHGNWKFTKVKTPEQYEKYGDSSSGSGSAGSNGAAGDDKMRSKEQCMRGEAIIAASNIASDLTGALSLADNLLAYIERGEGGLRSVAETATQPQAQQPVMAGVAADDQIPF